MKKDKLMLCTEIQKNKLYLAFDRSRGSLQPCIVKCTEESGWLRGFVEVTDTRTHGAGFEGKAIIKFVETEMEDTVTVHRRNANDAWQLGGSYQLKPVQIVPETWIMERVKEANAQIERLQKHQKFLIGLINYQQD